MNTLRLVATICAGVSACSLSHSAFTPVLGGQAYYDDQLDITWVANANINGIDTWANQSVWAAGLNIGGVTGWRLPNMDVNGDNSIIACSTDQAACKDNELGHLFYYGAGTVFGSGITSGSPGSFSNVQTLRYWSNVTHSSDPTLAWFLHFSSGGQAPTEKTSDRYAWAVHSGDVSAAPAAYPLGFVWDHDLDFDGGTVPQTTVGNPDDDQMGNPTWHYLNMPGGGDMNSTTPWYTQTPQLCVWDDDYQGFGASWVRVDNASPLLNSSYLQQDIFDASALTDTPAIRWANPTGEDIFLDIVGDIRIQWNNFAGGATPQTDVDVVFIHEDVSSGQQIFLLSTTVSTPVGGDDITIPISNLAYPIGVGDSVLLSLRSRQIVSSSQVFGHMNLLFTTVQNPAVQVPLMSIPFTILLFFGLLYAGIRKTLG